MSSALESARASGLIAEARPLLVLVSGGADSVCLLDVAVELGAEVSALHVNHGLREGADADEELCRSLCERLGVALTVERLDPSARQGNLQAWARDARYSLAERHAPAGADYATAHTATDQAETVLYRLAVSPGRRALLGMEPRRGRLVRPLLAATREETAAWCAERSLAFADDPSNEDPRFARARIRHQVMPALRELNPRVEHAIAETAATLREEAAVLETAASEALRGLAGSVHGPFELARLRTLEPALARLVLREAADAAGGGEQPITRRDLSRILALGADGGTSSLDLGGGLRAIVEYGTLRFSRAQADHPPEPVALAIPGSARFGPWTVDAVPGDRGEAVMSAEALGAVVTIRSWREGDRMRPVGLGGTKSLQDLFTDRKVPRELRRGLPVVEADGEIAWVAGLAVGERFRPEAGRRSVALSARRA